MVMLPGGFSGGDEPDGSGKFIATALRNEKVKEALRDMLYNRDGLMLGICNGFQALIKLGLVPFGDVIDTDDKCPTLTYNTIGRHVSTMADIKVMSTLSPWFNNVNAGEIYKVPLSHGEGRFIVSDELMNELVKNGQIATCYVDALGNPTYEKYANPNGSNFAVEGITSKDGRILGKMGHSERIGDNLYKNITGEFDMKIFEAGVSYFK
jgi:phosphoribosylformylglycinamidine synthase